MNVDPRQDQCVTINSIASENIGRKCSAQTPEKEAEVLSYIFAPAKNLILVRFAGLTTAYEHNVAKMNPSIQTMKIENPANVKDVITTILGRVRKYHNNSNSIYCLR